MRPHSVCVVEDDDALFEPEEFEPQEGPDLFAELDIEPVAAPEPPAPRKRSRSKKAAAPATDESVGLAPPDEQAESALPVEPGESALSGEPAPVHTEEPTVATEPSPAAPTEADPTADPSLGSDLAAEVARPALPAAPLALYRRYRPDVFADVIGQEHVTEPLQRALANNKVSHAYLFSGPRGCGKTTSARILARALNCERGPTPEPCGVCQSCRDLGRGGGGSIDVIEIDAASHGGVDDARDLRERAFFAPVHSRYKIYIVDEAHMVTAAGFNALLKVVEEPPPHVKFIFATTEPEKVIGTIRSRTHHYPFRLVPPKVLGEYLRELCEAEHVDVEPAVLPLVVRAGAGSVRDSLSVLDQLLGGAGTGGVTYDQAVGLLGFTPDSLLDEMVDAFAAGDGAGVFATIDKVVEVGQDPRRFAEDLLRRLRDLVIVAAVPDAVASGLIDAAGDQAERLAVQAQGLGAGELTRAAEVVAQGLVEMRGTTAPRLHLELMCARVLLPGADVAERGVHARLDRLERRLGMPGEPGTAPVTAQPGRDSWGLPEGGADRSRTDGGAAPREATTARDGFVEQARSEAAPSRTAARENTPSRPADGNELPRASTRGQEERGQAGRAPEGRGPGASTLRAPNDEPPPEEEWEPPSDRDQATLRERPAAVSGPGVSSAGRPAGRSAEAGDRNGWAERSGDGERAVAQDGSAGGAQERPVSPAGTRADAGAPLTAGDDRWSAAVTGPGAASGSAGQTGISADVTQGQSGGQGGLGAADVRRLWPEVLAAVMKRRRVTWMRLKEHAQVSEVRDGVLTLSFATEGSREQFAKGGHEDILRDALVEVMGADLRISAVAEGDAPQNRGAAAPARDRGASAGRGDGPGRGGDLGTGRAADIQSAGDATPASDAAENGPSGSTGDGEPGRAGAASTEEGELAPPEFQEADEVDSPEAPPPASPVTPSDREDASEAVADAIDHWVDEAGDASEPVDRPRTSRAELLAQARHEAARSAAAAPAADAADDPGQIDLDDPEVGVQDAEGLLRTVLRAEVIDDNT